MDVIFQKIGKLNNAFFDFDNTLYPGLLLFDLAYDFFSRTNRVKDLSELVRLLAFFKKGDYAIAAEKFALLLKGISVNDFYCPLDKYLDKIPLTAKNFIGVLIKNKVNCYLVSLTSEDISSVVCKKLGLKSGCAINYGVTLIDDNLIFTGELDPVIKNPYSFKLDFMQKASVFATAESSLAIGDSDDDLALFESCNYRILVGSNKKLANFELISKLNADWQEDD